MSIPDSAANEFRRELAARVRDEDDRSKLIDSKATSMITITATVTALLIGFVSSLILSLPETTEVNPSIPGNITLNAEHMFVEQAKSFAGFFVVAGLIVAIISIFIFLHSSNPKKYLVAMSSQVFFNKDGSINHKNVNWFKSTSLEALEHRITENYLATIKNYSDINQKRMKLIFMGQLLFAADVSLMLFAVIFNYLFSNPTTVVPS